MKTWTWTVSVGLVVCAAWSWHGRGLEATTAAVKGAAPQALGRAPGDDPGAVAFTRACATCHGADALGSFAPSLVPLRQDDAALLALVRSGGSQMLAIPASTLSDADVRAIGGYLRQLAGTPVPSPAQAPPAATRAPGRPSAPTRTWRALPTDAWHAVTDAMLAQPSPDDWLSWRRTLDGWGYSPLTEISRNSVGRLRLAWSWALEPGSAQVTPLVHDGVMYLANPGNVVQALDASTGDLRWEYRHPLDDQRRRSAQTRSLAVYEDLIYLNTVDAHVVALDARSGSVRWDTVVGAPGAGFTFTSGSVVADGVVVAGLTGCSRFDEHTCDIVGLDARTGRELWRRPTIARPGEPGGDTWGALPLPFRAGGDAWMVGSYDPLLKLIYWGTAQAKPWAQMARGSDGDALYTNATLALQPADGALRWHFQHLPGESYDMDEAFERVLIDHDGRRSAYTMGKLGILWELDRRTGSFVKATDLGYQTLVNIDAKTGRASYKPGMVQYLGREISFCPSTGGFKSLRAMAYSPDTAALYVPLSLNCETATFEPVDRQLGGGGTGPVRVTSYQFHPKSPDMLGELVALDVATGAATWRQRRRAPFNTATLTTAGGLVFVGTWDRFAQAYDAHTGALLWETRLPTMTNGFPMAYGVGGTEYVAFTVSATTRGLTWADRVPTALLPEIPRPAEGNALFVFALPKDARTP
ncbi:MAG: PQQ-binding-like beta-propeller repeat protein [Vicinamibacterales bacterium]